MNKDWGLWDGTEQRALEMSLLGPEPRKRGEGKRATRFPEQDEALHDFFFVFSSNGLNATQ
jgi:hypothetical protein